MRERELGWKRVGVVVMGKVGKQEWEGRRNGKLKGKAKKMSRDVARRNSHGVF